jgi:hypothetical protein
MAMTTKPWNAPGLLREGETAPQYMNQQLSSAPGDGGERNVIVDHMLGHQPVKPQQDSGRNASRYMYTINESSEYQQVFTRTVIGLAISEPYWMNTDFLFPLKYSRKLDSQYKANFKQKSAFMRSRPSPSTTPCRRKFPTWLTPR